jgi:PAS domain S-box-containing protein
LKAARSTADTGAMHPAILPAALALSAAICIALYVALRRDKSELHWLLLALLGSLGVWTGGTILRFSVSDEAGLALALRVVFLGIFTTPPLWLLLAVRYARAESLARRRGLKLGIALPSLLAYLALLSNDSHGLVIRELSFEALEAGARAWAGPVFWVFLAWAWGCVFGGIALYLGTMKSLVAGDERSRAITLSLASLIPALTSGIYVFHLLPVSFDLTPTALSVTLALLCVAVFRYELLETLPLARRDVIEHLHDGVLMASASGSILDLNRAAVAILGRPAAQLRGLPLREALAAIGDGESVAALHEGLSRLLPPAPPLMAEVRTADDRRVEVQVAWVRDGRGEPAGQFAVLRDRTEERRYERVVRHSQKLRTVGTLASGIAHEVNNPLAFIRANLAHIAELGDRIEEVLEAGGPDAKLARELQELGTIARETLDGITRIERIVAGIRRLASTREETLQPVSLNDVVEDAVRLANLAREPRLRVELRLAPELPPVDAAPERLVQALLNLLINARQALEGRDGTLCVETRRGGEGLEILVRDDGPGVPEEIAERIFDPFFTTKDPDRGTGLGLAIAFDILRDHGGVLELRESPGGGACFAACLPLHP